MQMQGGESIPVSAEAGVTGVRAPEAQAESADLLVSSEGSIAESEKANEMIDVHAPHGGIHTWRDFWIHLGTIALGLLIAIGLEQSVEWMHHLHQRHQLERDLRAELEVNHRRLVDNRRRGDIRRAWLVALRGEANRMRDSGGTLKLSYIPIPTIDPRTKQHLAVLVGPTEAAWTTAKESELVGLLPRDEAEIYSRLEIEYDYLTTAIDQDSHARDDVAAFEMRFKPGGKDAEAPEMARMTADELNEYSILLSRALEASGYVDYRSRLYDQETEAILHGASSEDEVLQSLSLPHGN